MILVIYNTLNDKFYFLNALFLYYSAILLSVHSSVVINFDKQPLFHWYICCMRTHMHYARIYLSVFISIVNYNNPLL